MRSREVVVIYLFLILLIISSLFLQPFSELVIGFKNIIIESDILISDYFEIGGFGASLLNSSLITLVSFIMMRVSKAEFNGMSLATLSLMFGFGLFGKNIVNIVPIMLGVYFYSIYAKERFSNVINIGLLATSFSPIVTEIMFVINLPPIIRIVLSLFIGVSVGFLITPVSRHLYNTHKGYNLYNVGFAIGLMSTLYVSMMKAFGFMSYQRLILSQGNNTKFGILLTFFFLVNFLYGYYLNGFTTGNLRELFQSSGYKTDFMEIYGSGTTYMNMGINGLIALFYVVFIAKGSLNGPSIGGILAVYGFGAVGKHWKNIAPILLGVILGCIMNLWNAGDISSIFAALFGTALAPLVGRYGWLTGIIVSLINATVLLNSGFLHGGMNLYNTGFSVGLVAAVVVPILEFFVNIDKKTTLN